MRIIVAELWITIYLKVHHEKYRYDHLYSFCYSLADPGDGDMDKEEIVPEKDDSRHR